MKVVVLHCESSGFFKKYMRAILLYSYLYPTNPVHLVAYVPYWGESSGFWSESSGFLDVTT